MSGLAIWCVLVAAVMPYFTIGLAKAIGPGYDNANPRQWLNRLEGLPARADAAHRNHFEAFPLFAAAVAFAYMRYVDTVRLDLLALAFILIRVLYTVCYLQNWSSLRSVVWSAGLVVSLSILGLAALG